jgi:hypothetical protein
MNMFHMIYLYLIDIFFILNRDCNYYFCKRNIHSPITTTYKPQNKYDENYFLPIHQITQNF